METDWNVYQGDIEDVFLGVGAGNMRAVQCTEMKWCSVRSDT